LEGITVIEWESAGDGATGKLLPGYRERIAHSIIVLKRL